MKNMHILGKSVDFVILRKRLVATELLGELTATTS
jgi:hypothetical protein